MKKFEPIVIQEETEDWYETRLYYIDSGDGVFAYLRVNHNDLEFSREAATRLRDALNKILEE